LHEHERQRLADNVACANDDNVFSSTIFLMVQEIGKLVGDVDFDGAARKRPTFTRVPGGVGPMTVTMLLVNTITSAERIVRGLKSLTRSTQYDGNSPHQPA